MRTTKTWFGLLILFFFIVIYLAPLGINYYFTNTSKFNEFVTYDQTEHQSCHINTIEPTIVLRMDDIRAYSIPSPYIINEIIDRNLSATLGVIPRYLEKDNKMITYLKNIKTNPNIEIAQHGTNHNESDINITEGILLEGNAKIQEILGVKPVTYIPPFNEVSAQARDAISKYFRIISGKEGVLKEGKNIAEIGYTEETYWYTKNQIVPLDHIIKKCKSSLDKTNLCVIEIHPQEYSVDINNSVSLSEERFEEFKEMLNKLQELNAKFSTFKDLVFCSES